MIGQYIKARMLSQKLQLLLSCIFAVMSFMQYSLFIWSDGSGEMSGLSNLMLVLSCFGLFIMSYVCGINSFNYRHDKNMTDMILSLPVNRKPRFWGDFLAGLSIVLAPYTASAIISTPLFTLYHANNTNSGWNAFEEVFELMFAGFLILLFMYAMTVFAVSLCGRLFEAISVPVIFGILIPVTTLLFVLITYGNAYGLQNDLEQFMLPIIATSPFPFAMWSISNLYDYFEWSMVGREIILAMVMTVLFIIGAFFLNITRKAEDTGKPFPVKIFFHIYITLIAFCITAAFMYFIIMRMEEPPFAYYNQGLTVELIVTIMIPVTLFAYFLFDVINNKGFKKPLLIFARWLVTTGVSVAICLGLNASGGFGAVNYIPRADNINSVTVEPWPIMDGTDEISIRDFTRNQWGITFKHPENIERVREFHRLSLQNRVSGFHSNYSHIEKYHPPALLSRQTISYTMNSGRSVERSYPATEEAMKPLRELLMSDEYKEFKLENARLLLQYNHSSIDVIVHYSADSIYEMCCCDRRDNRAARITRRDLLDRFMEAYRKDLYAETEAQMFSNTRIMYSITINEGDNRAHDRWTWGGRRELRFDVKAHYTNLIEFIETFHQN
jgi:hypothetical protein